MSDRAERATRAGLNLRCSRVDTRDLEVQISTNLCGPHDGLPRYRSVINKLDSDWCTAVSTDEPKRVAERIEC
jgi:hypothetical protein